MAGRVLTGTAAPPTRIDWAGALRECGLAAFVALILFLPLVGMETVRVEGGVSLNFRFDWVLIDCEHGTITLESAELMIIAAEASGVTPIVRPRTRAAQDVVELMDRGAAGVQVPHVITKADAQAAVDAVKFHPIGRRSLAAGTRASGYGYRGSLDAFTKAANQETLICVQIALRSSSGCAFSMLKVKSTSLAVNGWPSDHLTPSRILNVTAVRSSL